jgi:hypothetical protein
MSTTIKLYSASELKENFPDGFDAALENWQQDHQGDIFWMDETIESLMAIIKASGLTLKDYSLGTESYRSYVKIIWDSDEVSELSGQRARAWLENNLLNDLREHRTFLNRVKRYAFDGNKPHVYTKYNQISSCPFTGYCADEDYLESLIKDINDGCTLGEAYNNLADVCSRLLESEQEAQMSEEYFIDHADANDYTFTEDGQMVY